MLLVNLGSEFMTELSRLQEKSSKVVEIGGLGGSKAEREWGPPAPPASPLN